MATALFLLRRREGRRGTWISRWLTTLGLVAALYLPWVLYAAPLVAVHASDWVVPVSAWALFQRSLISYSVGQSVDALKGGLVAAGFILVAVIGPMVSRRRVQASGVWTAALYLLIPLLLSYVGSLYRPMFDEKYLISGVSFYLLLVSAGLVALLDRGSSGRRSRFSSWVAPFGGAGATISMRPMPRVRTGGLWQTGFGRWPNPEMPWSTIIPTRPLAITWRISCRWGFCPAASPWIRRGQRGSWRR